MGTHAGCRREKRRRHSQHLCSAGNRERSGNSQRSSAGSKRLISFLVSWRLLDFEFQLQLFVGRGKAHVPGTTQLILSCNWATTPVCQNRTALPRCSRPLPLSGDTVSVLCAGCVTFKLSRVLGPGVVCVETFALESLGLVCESRALKAERRHQ